MYVIYAVMFMTPKNDGIAFEDLPDDWVCPLCGAGKEVFIKE